MEIAEFIKRKTEEFEALKAFQAIDLTKPVLSSKEYKMAFFAITSISRAPVFSVARDANKAMV